MSVQIYVEGGGDRNSLRIKCREGFRKLLEGAGFKGHMPRITACGSRNDAYDDFKTAVKRAQGGDYPILLVDSEVPVQGRTPWRHLSEEDKWARPEGVEEEQAQLMVQCMETWCVADRKALRDFFGQCLNEGQLPALSELEARAKDEIQGQLVGATRQCGPARRYNKGRRSFELLGKLRAVELKLHLPHFKRLCQGLEEKLVET